MAPDPESVRRLAERLRELRTATWPDTEVTQSQLARALRVSVPSISSWENGTVLPERRLADYATVFATRRSLVGHTLRLPDRAELTTRERARREDLERELRELRAAATARPAAPTARDEAFGSGGFWHFPDLRPLTIVCAQLPRNLLDRVPYADWDDPDYAELSRAADIDSLFELYGHVRAVNPELQVNVKLSPLYEPDDLTGHLVVLGGVDWNDVTRQVLRQLNLPLRQLPREDEDSGCFEVDRPDGPRQFAARLVQQSPGPLEEPKRMLVEDVAHFYRGPNPFNAARTVTVCNGMHSRGTYGAVRALTDAKFRDRNTAYLKRRFDDHGPISILSRVVILKGTVVTPDWTQPETRLHEWPEAPS